MSVRPSTALPLICSGDMYPGVPIAEVCCAAPYSKILAVPKSVTFTESSEVNMMLAGLMSRCTTLWSCANCSAEQTCSMMCRMRGSRKFWPESS